MLRLPPEEETDLAPQLAVTALVEGTLQALRRVIETAHPTLALPGRRRDTPGVEQLAREILHRGDELRELLAWYHVGVRRDVLGAHEDDLF
jgi:hypothetical protein